MKSSPKIAVILFPGTNCELETARAVERNGMRAELFRWNEGKSLKSFDGAIIAGGFSYEDRGRSGLIASKDPLMKEVFALAKRGGVVMGICNGAQVLVETGLVPNFEFGNSILALTRNRRVKDGVVQGTGFYNTWTYLSANQKSVNAFNQFPENTLLRIPLAHAEGRFYSPDSELLKQLVENGQNAFAYCDENGELKPEFPVNPNGSVLNLAGVTNAAGNVMAMMPHPERAASGDVIFQSIKTWLTGRKNRTVSKERKFSFPSAKTRALRSQLLDKPKANVEFFIKLKITDNEALSVGLAAGIEIKKYRYVAMDFTGDQADLEKIIRSGDLLNTEKEAVTVKFDNAILHFDKQHGLTVRNENFRSLLPRSHTLAVERDTSLDAAKLASLNKTLGKSVVQSLKSGRIWGADVPKAVFEKAIQANFFHHPAAYDLMEV